MKRAYERGLCALLALALVVGLPGCGIALQAPPADSAISGSSAGEGDANLQETPAVPAVAPTTTLPPAAPLAGEQSQTAEGITDLGDLQAQLQAIYNTASPAVVNITTRIIQFDWFYQAVPQEGTGSGFLYDTEGHIVTNYHVIANADEISVAFADGNDYPATLIGQDPSSDLAVLRVDAPTLPTPLSLGDSDALRVGQFVVAIGNPFGLNLTMTFGIISSLGRVIETPNARFLSEAIQTDAPINPGNSGGPLLDTSGRVIGVNSQIISTSQSSAGIGFAVSSNTVRRVVPELIATGRFPHPWLGISMLTLTPERVRILKRAGASIDVDEGVLILDVQPRGPADAAGLRGGQRLVTIQRTRVPVDGDIIVGLDAEKVASERDVMLYLDTKTHAGQQVTVTYLRDGEEMTATVRLEARPEE